MSSAADLHVAEAVSSSRKVLQMQSLFCKSGCAQPTPAIAHHSGLLQSSNSEIKNRYKQIPWGTLFVAVDTPKLQLLSSTIQTILSVLEFALASPDQPLARVADYTAGGELHPAPKNFS